MSRIWPLALALGGAVTMLTTLRVPTRTSDGISLAEIISEIKLAVIPMMPIMQTAWKSLAHLKVAPRAP